jgi:hypothetical protein
MSITRIESTSILVLISLSLATTLAFSHGRRFAYTQQSNVLPAGGTELEIWNTFRFSRDYYFRRLDTRVEFEYGLGKNVMTAFYLNHEMSKVDDAQGKPGGSITTDQTVSLSSEWKFKLADPAADPFGFALYSEATLGLDEVELEGKLILDKQIGASLFACNFVVEHEWESELVNGVTHFSKSLRPGIDLGAAYYLSPTFSLGIEARYSSTIESGALKHSALFVGPSIAYATDRAWFVFTFLPQVKNLVRNAYGDLDLYQFERYQARMLFSLEI